MRDDNEFFKLRQDAIERMREMAKNRDDFPLPAPPFVKGRQENNKKPPKCDTPPETENGGFRNPINSIRDIFKGFNLPFFGEENESDTSVLLALLLLLFDNGGDRLLLYALIYILM